MNEQMKNIGPVCALELQSVDVWTKDHLLQLGWEEVFVRWCERFPNRRNMNAALAIIGAERDLDWRNIPTCDKQRAQRLLAQLRRSSQD